MHDRRSQDLLDDVAFSQVDEIAIFLTVGKRWPATVNPLHTRSDAYILLTIALDRRAFRPGPIRVRGSPTSSESGQETGEKKRNRHRPTASIGIVLTRTRYIFRQSLTFVGGELGLSYLVARRSTKLPDSDDGQRLPPGAVGKRLAHASS